MLPQISQSYLLPSGTLSKSWFLLLSSNLLGQLSQPFSKWDLAFNHILHYPCWSWSSRRPKIKKLWPFPLILGLDEVPYYIVWGLSPLAVVQDHWGRNFVLWNFTGDRKVPVNKFLILFLLSTVWGRMVLYGTSSPTWHGSHLYFLGKWWQAHWWTTLGLLSFLLWLMFPFPSLLQLWDWICQ
jgi:hypothetical protein